MRTPNPYTPGAGIIPPFLAGRETLIQKAEDTLCNVQNRYPQQSILYYGLRGVGKTVLLNTIENSADNRNILYRHIEVSENGKFTALLMGGINKFLAEISLKEQAKEMAKRCLNLVRLFKLTYTVEENTVEVSANDDFTTVSGIYSDDLTEIFVNLGKAAERSGDTICFFIDEIQFLSKEEADGLIIALHRCNQLRLPIVIFCAGLPKALKMIGEACSYSERLFQFENVGALSFTEAQAAIVQPAKEFNVEYEQAAIEKIFEITEGYPYFIQELCRIVWDSIEQGTVTISSVNEAIPVFQQSLDDGFFSVRYARCSSQERSFMTAMVLCGELPCTISCVAKIMGRDTNALSPCRSRLIEKGMIYSTGHAEIDFTVPQFGLFIKRINPGLSLTDN